MKFPNYQATIGIEVHVQLKTNSKIFCSCPNQFGQQPNTNICPICAGHPGILPVLNKKVVDYALMAGIATNCTINRRCDFARKHYTYPDLPKNYQITQSDVPICSEGYITIPADDGEKKVRIVRIHMEEDAGKNIHGTGGTSWVDLNRAGTPLLEIVSHPDMNSAAEARAYLNRLHTTVRYLGISDANMEEGSFRADINISVRKKGEQKLGTKVELKNINSFKFIVHAIDYEIERQTEALESGQSIHQETRLWDNKQQKTFFMRSKEEAQDYRYLTEPDVPGIQIDDQWFERIKKSLPELPQEKFNRFHHTNYQLPAADSEVLIQDRELADFFEAAVRLHKNAKTICNWILRDLLAYLKEHKLELSQTKITPQGIAELVACLDQGTINSKVAQEIFVDMLQTGKTAAGIIKEKNLTQIGSVDELEKVVCNVIAHNPDTVAAYKAGNERLFQFFVGQAMKETKGKGNPVIIQDLLKKHLAQ